MDIAITRDVARSIVRCELTFLDREPIDFERADAQHRAYVDRLEAAGLEVVRLPADEGCPDCCFVEDAAVVLDEVAVVTMPGAASRRAELGPVEEALRRFRRCERVALPATIDGGDVLQVGRRLFVGLTQRTNREGVEALRSLVAPHGCEVAGVPVPGCLHLKSGVTALDDETLIVNPAWVDPASFPGFRVVTVAAGEDGAANVLRVRGEVWMHAGFVRTRAAVEALGHRVVAVDVSEFLKAEAGLTCKSILLRRGEK